MKRQDCLGRLRLLIAASAAGLAAAAAGQEIDLSMKPADYPLSQVRLGRQVWGERLSRLDFEGRVVVAYTWCVTCPLSRREIARINDLYAKYRERGLVVAGFQCRRFPWIIENHLVYACHRLQPAWPVLYQGWVSPWPVEQMPWAAVFDHTGEMVYAGGLRRLESAVVKALDAAPDYMLGGPYKELAGLAGGMAQDRPSLGRRMPEVRERAAGPEDDAAAREARAMLSGSEAYVENRFAKADEDPANVVARVRIYEEVAGQFAGDALADRAAEKAAGVMEKCVYPDEEAAYGIYEKAWTAFRALPPDGEYAYSMAYTLSDDPRLLAGRRRIITEFRWAMLELSEWYPATWAGARAIDARLRCQAPPMSAAEAERKLKTARALLEGPQSPLRTHEARLQFMEIVDGYLPTDAVSTEAMEQLDELWSQKSRVAAAGAEEYDDAKENLAAIEARLSREGARIKAEEAAEALACAREIRLRGGPGSYLAAEAEALIGRLEPLAPAAGEDAAQDGPSGTPDDSGPFNRPAGSERP
ncbi:MAG: hypothetical protein FJ225_08600 [Lentisphaerae bacterium]|nr:hypothetical protein [Lentisphaerota bacterium]